MKLSAIDLGSNALRMMVSEFKNGRFYQLKKYRIPLRLGTDVFNQGFISESHIKLAEKGFQDFSKINEKMKIIKCRAVATSATREAKNGPELVDRIFKASGIKLELIDGISEAQLLFSAVKNHVDLKHIQVLLIDIGGGSVEITHVDKGIVKNSQSFLLGTVRILDQLKKRKMSEHHVRLVIGDLMQPLVEFFNQSIQGISLDYAIGTGGNFESMSRLKSQLLLDPSNEYILVSEIEKILEKLSKIPIKKRIEELGIRPDRADVIIPATVLVETLLRQAGLEKVRVPGVGLREGILYSLI
jgi:exopolyphosphatase / guanosine-5'-triphosphate,3'-diphosphate pyrophosphatase